jgi:hypothetical protein
MSQIILVSNQNMWSSRHKFLWSLTETYEVHIINFCDLQLKHLKFMSYFFVISNWVIWSQITIFLHYLQDSGHVVELSWSAFQGGMTHPTPFLFGLSTTPSFISTNLKMVQPMPPPFFLGYQPLHPSSSPLISRWINLLLDDLWHNKVEHVMFAPTHSLGSWVVHHGQFIDQLPPSHGNWGKIVSRMDKGFRHVRLEMQG